MKNKKVVFDTLRQMLRFYDNYRFLMKMTEDEATEKTLEVYSDYYEWLKGELKEC